MEPINKLQWNHNKDKKIIKDEHNALLQFIHVSLSLSWMSKLPRDGLPTIVDKFSKNKKHKTYKNPNSFFLLPYVFALSFFFILFDFPPSSSFLFFPFFLVFSLLFSLLKKWFQKVFTYSNLSQLKTQWWVIVYRGVKL